MKETLLLAQQATKEDEVPVGAIIVKNNSIIASAYNKKESDQLVTSHAEIIAIEAASKKLGTWRLNDCEIYVSLEPCLMCAGAIYQARIKKVHFACHDPKGGALGSLYSLHEDNRLNHDFSVEAGLYSDESSQLLKTFFKSKRKKNKKHST